MTACSDIGDACYQFTYPCDWELHEVIATSDTVYRYHVRGVNHSSGEEIFWTVPELIYRYGFTCRTVVR